MYLSDARYDKEIGTLAYMAPEQARAEATILAAADIYSLGRVAYQALSGPARSPGQHIAALLARALFELEPPLSQKCPWVPEQLSELISRMLAKDPGARPQNGAALLREVLALSPLSDASGSSVSPTPLTTSSYEQRLYSIVLAMPAEAPQATVADAGSSVPFDSAQAALDVRDALESTLHRHGANPSWLRDGSLLLTMEPAVSAHDQAALAARCALLIKAQWPTAKVALATGRGLLAGSTLIGEVVDRAARLMTARQALYQENSQAAAIAPESICVDALSASLLERSFVLMPVKDGALLIQEMASTEELQPILTSSPPCMGREEEFTILDAILARCREESEAQSVLITALPGLGKTRLRQEFVARARRRSRPVTVLLGVGESLSAGAPYSLLRQGLWRLCGITNEMKRTVAQQALIKCCIELLGAVGRRAALFLAEICGLPFADQEAPELRTARSDPKLMSTCMSESFVDFLEACCDRAPVVLILDDLQWGDFLTVHLVDKALHELEARPLLVVALARPEMVTTFPQVQQWPRVNLLPLKGLSRSASERIVRFALGNTVDADVVARIAQHAAGNALLLEELIRAEREHPGEPTPETVLAILQARMGRLEPPQRLLLGLASIFGNQLWAGGLRALLDGALSDDVDFELRALVKAELITPHKASRLKGEIEYSFRHPLMCEAAYGLLLDEQKRRWHQLAGQYLERAGEPEALVLAEHFSRSNNPSLAAPHLAHAAERLLEGNDLEGARTCIERGLACQAHRPAEGEKSEESESDRLVRGELLGIRAMLLYRTLELAPALQAGEAALRLLPPGSMPWCQTFYALCVTATMSGPSRRPKRLCHRGLARIWPTGAAAPARRCALAGLCGCARSSSGSGADHKSALDQHVGSRRRDHRDGAWQSNRRGPLAHRAPASK